MNSSAAETVQLLLSHRAILPNSVHPPGSGTTALHLAATLGRAEIVSILLEQPEVDDTLRDSQGHTCKDIAKGKDVIQVLQDSRSFLSASYRSLLHSYALSPLKVQPSQALMSLLESPRAKGIDLSYLDDTTGTSLLHEAARRKDLRFIELVVRAGADVFVRDRRGKMAYDGLGKDDRVRVFLRQFVNHDQSLIDVPVSEPPVLKGYLNKYTNVAKGYNTRWFVLKDGVLSYYRHQEEEEIASRGAVSMKMAALKTGTGADKTRFEVYSTPVRGHATGAQRWYIRANHPVEAARWTQAITRSIEWYRREADKSLAGRRSTESDKSALRPTKIRTSFQSGVSAMRELGTHKLRGDQASLVDATEEYPPIIGDTSKDSIQHPDDAEVEEAANRLDSSAASEITQSQPPHGSNFDLQGNSLAAQMDLTVQLLAGLPLASDATLRTHELREALKESFSTVQSMINEYLQMAKEREEWWRSQLKRERDQQTVWEESLQTVVREGEALEKELRARSRKRGSRFFDGATLDAGLATVKRRPLSLGPSSSAVASAQASTYFTTEETPSVSLTLAPVPDGPQSPVVLTPTQRRVSEFASPRPIVANETEDFHDTDEEDEFFDAIESGNLPNLVVSELLTSPIHSTTSLPLVIDLESFLGYKHLRTELPIGNDDRPSTSLWSVLKHSIGKDLTRISFPVFFNEPTSMLQRMAEDMEFSECLDVAVQQMDPHRRIAFVAAFAMSNYSSTIGRIAKPFNPILNETFEYMRLDKEYRYMSEQVSHHPPISACWAESPNWHYFGEVDAQNKFMGKSFEIRPTGVAHAELLLPEEWGPNYPKATTVGGKGKVVEHFSWKKVTTNVSGFILGSPTIDHYGDMIVTNHRTGDQCILTFKPRGWRGKDAFEISGCVRDSDGEITYEIAGRWNSQLICRAIGTGSGYLHPDATVGGPASPNYMAEYIYYGETLKNLRRPSTLLHSLSRSTTVQRTHSDRSCALPDCRLRPDQRAFEMGKYERANDLKHMQEERQRATRRAREDGRLPPHRPRWFIAETDGDTGERVWTPSRTGNELEYWLERERVWKEGGKRPWQDVDPIFIEDIP
ncbi:hypothetical protein JVU11DRAFT_8275 [Chiua virens]|nr:hypothetical protein JVU11DRAFT_8275 [Chiua virens]